MLNNTQEIKTFWVKKKVSNKNWNTYYSQAFLSSYCFLKKEKDGVWIGFLVANQIPITCEECNEDEIRQIDLYRRAGNIKPFPLKDISTSFVTSSKEPEELKLDAEIGF